jgi:hypothetical protein
MVSEPAAGIPRVPPWPMIDFCLRGELGFDLVTVGDEVGDSRQWIRQSSATPVAALNERNGIGPHTGPSGLPPSATHQKRQLI